MTAQKLPVTCPLCGRITEHSLANLREGEDLICFFCGVKLNLHGHMWKDIQNEIEKLKKTDTE